MERGNVVMFKGKPITLLGEEARVGDRAGNFKALARDMTEKTMTDFQGKIKLIASVPSLDTPVCDSEIKRFNDEAAVLSKDIAVIFVSMDLPFAQKRFCQEFDINKIVTLSDHRDASFGSAYGVLIKELRLLARAIFVMDKTDRIRYVEYVKELTNPPNYNAALSALKGVVADMVKA